MTLWIILTINSIAMGGLLFLLSSGFSLIFGLMRIPNLTHGSLFMLGAYFGVTFLRLGINFWIAALLSALVLAVIVAAALWLMLERTRLGATIRAGVDDPEMARVTGINVSRLFTAVFCLGSGLAGLAGVLSGPILSVYPGLDAEMLPLALIIVILGGAGSLPGALLGSFIVGFIYNFGQVMFPEFAYVVLFLPMVLVLVLRPQGLFGRQSL